MSTTSPERQVGGHPSQSGAAVASVLRTAFSKNIRQSGMLLALAVIVVYYQIVTHGTTLHPANVSNVIQQNGYILVLAIGMVIVIIAGHIDLSVGSVAALTGAVATQLMVKQHWPWGWAVIAALVVGALIGCWQGFWIAYIGIPSFIVTLSSMLVFRGVTFTVLGGRDVGQLPQGFRDRTTGFLPKYDLGFGGKVHNLTIVLGLFFALIVVINQWRDRRVQTRYGAEALPFYLFVGKVVAIVAFLLGFTWLLAKYNGYPVVLLILAFLLLTYGFMMKRTVLGRHIYAVGGNAPAAKLSGVKSQRVTFFVFVNMGVLAALCGLLITARLNSATQSAGNFFELEAIAAAFIGGASASGGVGTVLGAVIGGLVTAVIANGLSLTSASTGRQYVVRGLLLLFAVAFDIFNKKRVGR